MNQTGNYLKLSYVVPADRVDAAVALLADAGCEGFEEDAPFLHVYLPEGQLGVDELRGLLEPLIPGVTPSVEIIPPQNWNEAWEKNFPEVEIGRFCQVVPGFRQPKPGFAHTLRIEPKMSFGTGHHATTRLMMEWAEGVNFEGKTVLDMGCGTGILGLLACQLGAQSVLGVDYDPWCFENASENVALNGVKNMEIALGGAEIIAGRHFDIIFANINRNVLVEDGSRYVQCLNRGGLLATSGFFDFDEQLVKAHFESLGLAFSGRKEENGWMLLSFRITDN